MGNYIQQKTVDVIIYPSCAITVPRNDGKCKYLFMLPEITSTRHGLRIIPFIEIVNAN